MKRDYQLFDRITQRWLEIAHKHPMDWRTRGRWTAYYRRGLIAYGKTPMKAKYDEAGNCTTCGEGGRCPGWHYAGEVTP